MTQSQQSTQMEQRREEKCEKVAESKRKGCCCCSRSSCKNRREHRTKSAMRELLSGASFLVFLVATSVYWNSLHGDFVHDDVVSIVRNPDVRVVPQVVSSGSSERSKTNFQTPPFTIQGEEEAKTNGGEGGGDDDETEDDTTSSGWWQLWKNDFWGMPMASALSHKSYRPLTVLTFRLNFWMGGGLSPVIFHGTNVFIHGLVSTLCFVLCRIVLGFRLRTALFASLMFALHPIHSEAIAGVTGRSDALACLLMIVSFLLYHRSLTAADAEEDAGAQLSHVDHVGEGEEKGSESWFNQGESETRVVRVGGGKAEKFSVSQQSGEAGSSSSSTSSSPCLLKVKKGKLGERKKARERFPRATTTNGTICKTQETSTSTSTAATSGDCECPRFGKVGTGEIKGVSSCCWLIASSFIGCLAMLAKETGVTVLGINLLYDLYTNFHLRRPPPSHQIKCPLSLSGRPHSTQLRHRVTFLIALVAIMLGCRVAIMSGTFPRFSRQDNPAAYSKSEFTRLLTYAFLPVFNFSLLLFPFRLSYDWQMGSIPLVESLRDWRNAASALFYLSILLLLRKALNHKFSCVQSKEKGTEGKSRGRAEAEDPGEKSSNCELQREPLPDGDSSVCSHHRYSEQSSARIVFVALLFLLVPFLPASNLLFPVGFVVAERILYTPSLGICILTAFGFECLLERFGKLANPVVRRSSGGESRGWGILRTLVGIIFPITLLLVSFGWRTWDRNFVWHSRLSLFQSGIKDNPGNAKMHYNFANLQKDLGNTKEAIHHYTTAIQLWPEYASAHNNLGTLLEDPSGAEQEFLQALSGNQAHGGAHFNLGVLYMRKGKYEEALEHLEECLTIDPSHAKALQHLGACYNILNKTHEAESVFHKLSRSDLPLSKVHTNFGIFLQELGLDSDALSHFLLALAKNPTSAWGLEAFAHAVNLAFNLGSEKLLQEIVQKYAFLPANGDPVTQTINVGGRKRVVILKRGDVDVTPTKTASSEDTDSIRGNDPQADPA